jgi:hypothetical protein
MGLWSKLTGGETASTTTGRAAAERRRREREIRAIDNRTARWLNGGGLDPKRKTR